jgi:Condensation domain
LAGLADDRPSYPLTWTQEQMWFYEQLFSGSAAYHVGWGFRLRGQLRLPALHHAIAQIVERHAVLRTAVVVLSGRPVGVICAPAPVLVCRDMLHLPVEEREPAARRVLEGEMARPFDLASGMLLRAHLLRLADHEHILWFVAHHLACDARSVSVLLEDLRAGYDGALSGDEPAYSPTAVTFADYARRRREDRAGWDEDLAYWRAQLAGLQPLPWGERPMDPGVHPFAGATWGRRLAGDVLGDARALGRRAGATPFMVLLAAYAQALRLLTGAEDCAIGVPCSTRDFAGSSDPVGPFVHTLLIRVRLHAAGTFLDLIRQVRRVCLEGYAHQRIPLVEVLRAVDPPRPLGTVPLMQTMLVLHAWPEEPFTLAGLAAEPYRVPLAASEFDLTLYLDPDRTGVEASVEYSTALFDTAAAARLLTCLEFVLKTAIADPEQHLAPVSAPATAFGRLLATGLPVQPRAGVASGYIRLR